MKQADVDRCVTVREFADVPGPAASPACDDHGDRRAARVLLLALGAAAVILAALAAVRPMPAFDLWWQLKTGELIWTTRSVPHADVFSHTAAGDPWVVQEWLTEVVLYLLYTRVGPGALVAFKVIAISGAMALVLWRCWTRTGRPFVAVGMAVLATYAARGFFDIRPQVLTFLFLAYTLLVLDQWRLGRWPRAIWSVPPVIWLWMNCHNGFMVGLTVLAVETVGLAVEALARGERHDPRWRTLAGVLGASAVAGLCGPNGIESYLYPIELLTHGEMLNQIVEWLSPNFHLQWLRPYEILLIGAIVGWGLSTRPRRVADVLLTLGLIQASLYSTRHTPVFAIVCAPIVAEHVGSGARAVQDWIAARVSSLMPLRVLAAGAVAAGLAAGITLEWRRLPDRDWFAYCTELAQFPHAAVDFIRRHPGEGNLFNEYDWGGYCLYRLYPDQKIFVDGRAEVYFEKGFGDYAHIANIRAGWGNLLDEWNIDTILVPPQAPLVKALPMIGGWRIVFQDANAIVFRRDLRPESSGILPRRSASNG